MTLFKLHNNEDYKNYSMSITCNLDVSMRSGIFEWIERFY